MKSVIRGAAEKVSGPEETSRPCALGGSSRRVAGHCCRGRRLYLRFTETDAIGSALPKKASRCLPFENLSEEKQNAYFADGVQDQVLTDLAQIADLKVISRTSRDAVQERRRT